MKHGGKCMHAHAHTEAYFFKVLYRYAVTCQVLGVGGSG